MYKNRILDMYMYSISFYEKRFIFIFSIDNSNNFMETPILDIMVKPEHTVHGRRHHKKTGVSVYPQKGLMSSMN